MCRDTIRDGSYCGHQQHYYGQYGNHFRRDLRHMDPYQQSNYCESQTRYDPRYGWCPPCSTGHMTQQGWNYRGYVPRSSRYY
jgi:hypothetical protein